MTTFIDMGGTSFRAASIDSVVPGDDPAGIYVSVYFKTVDKNGLQNYTRFWNEAAAAFLRFWNNEALPGEVQTFSLGPDIARCRIIPGGTRRGEGT